MLNPADVRSIVAIRCSRLGDLLFTTPALRLLRERFPEARLTMVTTPATVAALDVPGLVHEVVGVELKGFWRRLAGKWGVPVGLPRALRGVRPDLAVAFSRRADHQELARRLRPRHCWAWERGGKPRSLALPEEVHLSAEGRAVDPALVPPERPVEEVLHHTVTWNVALIDPLLGDDPPPIPPLEIARDERDRAVVAESLRRFGAEAARPLVWIHPGFHGTQRAARLDDAGKRAWPEDRWRDLARVLVADGAAVALTSGSEAERRACERIAGDIGPAVQVLPGLSSRQLAALGERSAAFVGLDSGPMHVAAAVGVPLVALFGPTRVAVTGPWTAGRAPATVLRLPLPCAPCRGSGAKCQVNQCLRLIEAHEVAAHVRPHLSGQAERATSS